MPSEQANALAQRLVDEYRRFPETLAIVWGGSQANDLTDQYSDLDIYVYQTAAIPLESRAEIAHRYADNSEVGNTVFESGDEFVDRATGLGVDLIFRPPEWVEDELNRALRQHQAKVGYTTAFCYNIQVCRNLYDPQGWFARQQAVANEPYPEELRRAIIVKNYPLLREAQSSYFVQIEKSLTRQDKISYNHRVAALIASYFDILFALNRQFHPGEKRLIPLSKKLCKELPANFESNLNTLIDFSPQPENAPAILETITFILDELDKLLVKE